MVRHHVKKKNKSGSKDKAKKKREKERQLEEALENLDRFAGSSDEDDDAGAGGRRDEEEAADRHIGGAGDGSLSDGDGDGDGDGEENIDNDDENRGISDSDSDNEGEEEHKDDNKKPLSGNNVGGSREKKAKKESASEPAQITSQAGATNDGSDDSSREDESFSDDSVDSGDDNQAAEPTGMANAMSRILGLGHISQPTMPTDAPLVKPVTTDKAVVLSKTTTPLQRLQQKIKGEEQALRLKRKERREENLTAMRLPLAPNAGISFQKSGKRRDKNAKRKRSENDGDDNDEASVNMDANAIAIANEIESERTHRRIATRGVVALFNAISTHRQTLAAEAAAKQAEKERMKEEGRSYSKKNVDPGVNRTTTKHGFLDLIKQKAMAGSTQASYSGKNGGERDSSHGLSNSGGDDIREGRGKSSGNGGVGWSALKDDFMMNSKLKDWDKEVSDDESNDGSNNEGNDFDDASMSGEEVV